MLSFKRCFGPMLHGLDDFTEKGTLVSRRFLYLVVKLIER